MINININRSNAGTFLKRLVELYPDLRIIGRERDENENSERSIKHFTNNGYLIIDNDEQYDVRWYPDALSAMLVAGTPEHYHYPSDLSSIMREIDNYCSINHRDSYRKYDLNKITKQWSVQDNERIRKTVRFKDGSSVKQIGNGIIIRTSEGLVHFASPDLNNHPKYKYDKATEKAINKIYSKLN